MYNSIIIGFGKGGKTLASSLAKKGEKVALIEKSKKMYGGTCINVGCLPSKNFVKNSEKSLILNKTFEEKRDFYKESVLEKNSVISMLNKKNYDMLNNLENVDVIDGIGSFIDKNTIKIVNGNDETIIDGEKIFINTGSTSRLLNVEGIKDNPNVFTSDQLLDLEELPKQLTIIGGGFIGLEFASMYAGFGSKVNVLIHNDSFLPNEDNDMALEIKKVLESKGINFIFNANTTKIINDKLYYKKDDKEEVINETKVLVAIGRIANIKELDLENAGVEGGLVKVDKHHKTSVDNIYAMGDVCDRLQFTYISLDDYRIVMSTLFENGKYSESDRGNIPSSVFLSPSFSKIGIIEKEAIKQGYNIKVSKMPASAIPKAQVIRKTQGYLKAIVDKDTNKILGVFMLCEDSHEIINIVKVAMDLNADYTVLRDTIYTHPTMSEVLNSLLDI